MSSHEAALIAGAGPIGLACAISARRRGIDPLVIDAGAIAESIVRYPVGLIFFTTPERLEIGGHPMVCAGSKPTREEALMYYRGVARAEGLRVRTYTRLLGAERVETKVVCRVQRALGGRGVESVECDRLVLATGYFDHPKPLGVPGEDLPHVSHYSVEAHRLAGLDVVIVGAKNSAVELALNAFRVGARVTVVHRGASLKPTVKYWLRPDFENRVRAGEIAVLWNAVVQEIRAGDVVVRASSGITCLAADRVFLLTGYHPDFGLLRSIGITVDDETGRPTYDPETLETDVPGVHIAGSLTAGKQTSEVFIENGRFDGERIFGDAAARRRAEVAAARAPRPQGE
jgi:thioredoxin reductase (NADPH)